MLFKEKNMKKLLFLPLLLLAFTSCGKEPDAPLPPLNPEKTYYAVQLTAANSTITEEDSVGITTITLEASLYYAPEVPEESELMPLKAEEPVTYTFEIGPAAYLGTSKSGVSEIQLKELNYIRSVSNYKVDRICVDYFGAKGLKHSVNNTIGELEGSTSQLATLDPNDGGEVMDYPILDTYWNVAHNGSGKCASIYAITVIFEK